MTCRGRAALGAALLGLLLGLPAGASAAGWGPAFRLAGPFAADAEPAQLALLPSGEIAAGFSIFQEDSPEISQAWLAVRGGGRPAPPAVRRVPAAGQVLGLAFDGTVPAVLAGVAASGQPCCAGVELTELSGRRFAARHAMLGGLTGATAGSLEPLPSGGLLAAAATDRGVWVAQSRQGPRLGTARRLGSGPGVPWVLATGEALGGQTSVGWLAAPDGSGQSGPGAVLIAGGSPLRLPGSPQAVFSAAEGHEIDELALAPLGSVTTAAWILSWFDAAGAYHAEPMVADLGRVVRPASFVPPAGETSSALTMAGGPVGDQVLGFRDCDGVGDCWVEAGFRAPGAGFGAPVRLGTIDPGQEPAAVVTGNGTAVVAWIHDGQPFAVTRSAGARGFGAPHRLSSTGYAADLTLAAGARGRAVAAWTQGTLNTSVVAAELG